MLELAGRFVPLVTPFTDDGSTLSEVRLARLVRFYLDRSVEGLALATETGEFGTLSQDERKQLLEWVCRASHNALPVVANVSTLSTSASLDLAQHAARHGARAAVLIPPFFGAFSQSELLAHVQMVGAHAFLPIIVVDPQSRFSQDSIAALTHMPNVHLSWPESGQQETHADWFRCYGLQVSPTFGIPDSTDSDFMLRNRAAVTKTLLIDDDLEMGPPRMPVLPIPYQEIRSAA